MSFGCTPESNHYSPQEMVNQALAAEVKPLAFYGESTSVISENGKEVKRFTMKEWRNDEGKIRTELQGGDRGEKWVSVNDGTSVISYDQTQNQAVIIDDPEILELNQPSPKKQVDFILEKIVKTHEISDGKEEEIAGRKTQHIIAEPKKDNNLYGKQELWIDKENWIVLKMISVIGDQTQETIYNEIDFDTNIPEEKFSLDLPKDVEIKNLNEESPVREITLEDVPKELGKSILYIPETNEWQIDKVELIEFSGEFKRKEVSMDYIKNDVPFLNLSVFKTPDKAIDENLLPNEQTITIRGKRGTYTNDESFHSLLWDENGLRYSLLIDNQNIELKQIKELIEKMVLFKEDMQKGDKNGQ
ncbi:LolA family protein [Virgibacillus proomii]|uniref:LolA family protein n=1 Tax=Virgibacillus proomii TaxID=84407 RepID=UPI001C10EF5E|nr:sigma-E factor regulatory protein RseB domain-containing protein [Virgibacillus proomii]MBU5267310.1 outer membrane lipoprotein carrier protein LolA [Virgibacillus proomii]